MCVGVNVSKHISISIAKCLSLTPRTNKRKTRTKTTVAFPDNGEPARVDTQMTHRKLSFVESGHDINMDRYGEWTVIKLKNELRNRGAVTTGRKTDLIER